MLLEFEVTVSESINAGMGQLKGWDDSALYAQCARAGCDAIERKWPQRAALLFSSPRDNTQAAAGGEAEPGGASSPAKPRGTSTRARWRI